MSSSPVIEPRRLWWIGAVAIVAANAAVLLVRAVAFATLNLSRDFPPLTPQALIMFTTVLVAIGVGVFAVVMRRAQHPIATYKRIALIALIVSMIPDPIMLPNNGPGATWTAVIVLMVMHVAAWFSTVTVLTRMSAGTSG